MMEETKKIHLHDAAGEAPAEAPTCELLQIHPEVTEKVRAAVPDVELQMALADLFRMFGDTTRIQILSVLDVSEMCVCDIAELLGLTVSAVSHQLRLLKTAGLVSYRREGKNVIYALADDHVRTIMDSGMEHILE